MVDRYHCGGYAVSVPRDPERDHITEERLSIIKLNEKKQSMQAAFSVSENFT